MNKLQYLMNNAMLNEDIPKTWNLVSITLIPKENTDPTNVKSYRPILLLNLDYKVFAKILADRIKIFLVNFIWKEQTGFFCHSDI